MDAERVPGWGALTRMTRIHRMLSRLRTVLTTVAATIVGVVNVSTRRMESTVELKPGDLAPDFTLPGADGRILAIDKEVHAASHGRDIVARLDELGVTHLTS